MLKPLPTKCGECLLDHDELIFSPSCHPGSPMYAKSYPKAGMVELQCAACGKTV